VGRRFAAAALMLVAALSLTGCGAGVGTVSGTVTYKGQPLTVGVNTVAFHGQDGTVVSCVVEPDGSYTARKVPVGPARISLQCLPPPPNLLMAPGEDGKPKASGSGAARPGRAADVPARYRDPEQSRLTCVVRRGEQRHDIELTP
jgi:hypothetical protein